MKNLLLCLLILIGNDFSQFSNFDNNISDELPVVEIVENNYNPKDGLDLDEAKLLIIGERKNSKELKKALNKYEIIEITVEELWLNSQCQIYLVGYDNPNEVVFIKNKNLIKRLPYSAHEDKFS